MVVYVFTFDHQASNALKKYYSSQIKNLIFKFTVRQSVSIQKFHFRSGFHVFIEENGILEIQKNVFFNNNCSITAREKISIGSNCIFGENVKIYDHNHEYKDKSCLISKQGFSSEKVIIEEDCWIGSNVTILKGVHIGKHSVVGAGVIVYKDIPENSVIICKQELINLCK